MNIKILFLVFLVIGLSSCGKNENLIPNDQPTIPNGQFIDVDNDGVDDFLIKYYSAFIYSPTSSKGIICQFEILGENEKLAKEGSPFLFLTNTDEISKDVTDPLKWNSVDAYLATIENHSKDGWPENWKIATNDIKDSYFIGIKLNKINTTDIGWIKFEIDAKSGNVTIIEKKIL